MGHSFKILQVAAVDVTVKAFLLPLFDRLKGEGYEVHIACSEGQCVPDLKARGYEVHPIAIERRINPVSNLRSLWLLYRLMKREQFDIVHVHTPVAAAVGRVAAWAAGVPVVIYTAHGFYFHEHMSRWTRRAVIRVERLLARATDMVFAVSCEDSVTAVKEAICPRQRVIWIGAGVDISRFAVEPGSNGVRGSLGLGARDKVIGFVGRLVAEKGIVELIEAMELVARAVPDAKLLIVGDTLSSDRDRKTKEVITGIINRDGLSSRVIFAGFREDIPRLMSAIDVFVLPSYREGMPVTVIEAMASGKPVVATRIRGCREEVVNGVNGLLVPVRDSSALATAIINLLSNPDLARKMGDQGRQRAREMFDERVAIGMQLRAYDELVRRKLAAGPLRETAPRQTWRWLKRAMDIALSSASLILLCVPFLVIAALIKMDSRGPVFFRQERIGRRGRPFRIWKFRTMVEGAVNRGLGLNIAQDDPRITRAGKLLREWGLDELPQLINVFNGEMSIVGPRPIYRIHVERYDEFQRQRLLARPGITSLAIVHGRNLLTWRQRIRLDVWYIKHWSPWLDVKIMFQTFWAVLVTRKGVYGAEGINDNFVASSSPEVQRQIAKHCSLVGK